MSTPTPRLLGGRYELGELIGRGGMAEVHRGYDARLGRPVAVKILRSDHARDASFLHRFRREAQSVAGLNHRSIVAVYDSGEDRVTETGGAELSVPYIVMELVEGRTLREVLNEEGTLAPDEAARIVEGVLDALAYSHRMGIVHRDIKPGNVMLGEGGEVKVMDFGIARAMADTQATMTQTSAVIGTAQYVSPEQARGETVDNRSDIYSTGCLLFELLTSRTPYTGEPISLTYQHVNADIPIPSTLEPDVPEDLDAIVAHSLTKDRDERYQDAADMADDLRDYRARRPISPAAMASLAAVGAPGPSGDTTVAMSPSTHIGDTGVVPVAAPGPLPPERRERPRQRGLGWLMALIILIPLLALGWYVWDMTRGEDVQQVAVPQLVGEKQADAKRSLEDLGLRANPVPQEDADVPEGEVISQETEAGTQVDPNTEITYAVSAGTGQTFVPKLVGLTEDAARKAITDAGLEVGEVTTEDSPDQKRGHVVSASPGEAEQVDKGRSVNLVVASGRVKLPDVTGKKISEVRSTLYNLGLKLEETTTESDQPKDTVLRQRPGAGTVPQGATIFLTVAAEPAATVTETPDTPTDTPTTTDSPTTEPSPTGTGTPSSPTTPNTDQTTGQTP